MKLVRKYNVKIIILVLVIISFLLSSRLMVIPGILTNNEQAQGTLPGIVVTGEATVGALGVHVSGIGDINADGFDDFLIGAPSVWEGHSGKVYLILGRQDSSWVDFDLSQANASFIGEQAWDWAGRWTSGVGDVNGDNYDDFAISSIFNDEGGDAAGQTYLFFGGPNTRWAHNTLLSLANASFLGEAPGDESGHGVYGLGDINNDSFDDILISGMYNDEGGTDAGQIYLIFGRPTNYWTMDLSLTQANASYIGNGDGDTLGIDAAGVGDVNNDNYSDFVVGAWVTANSIKVRKLYLILGCPANHWSMDQPISQANASIINEHDTSLSSMFYSLDWISGAGDVNSDGYDDFIFGAYEDDHGGNNAGQTYLFFGRSTDSWKLNLNFSHANATFICHSADDWSGSSVSGVGDVNKDGYSDFVIGSPGENSIQSASYKGQAYLFLGRPSNQWTSSNSLTEADRYFSGQSQEEGFGFHVSGVGDVNNDGFHDFTISAPFSANKTGKVYLIFHPFDWSTISTSLPTTPTEMAKSSSWNYWFVLLSLLFILFLRIKKRR